MLSLDIKPLIFIRIRNRIRIRNLIHLKCCHKLHFLTCRTRCILGGSWGERVWSLNFSSSEFMCSSSSFCFTLSRELSVGLTTTRGKTKSGYESSCICYLSGEDKSRLIGRRPQQWPSRGSCSLPPVSLIRDPSKPPTPRASHLRVSVTTYVCDFRNLCSVEWDNRPENLPKKRAGVKSLKPSIEEDLRDFDWQPHTTPRLQ